MPNLPPRAARHRFWVGAIVVLTLLLVGSGVALGIVDSRSSPVAAGKAPLKSLLSSVQNTQADKTAALDLSMNISVPGHGSITATGKGTTDFTNDAAQVSFQYAGLPALDGLQLSEVFVANTLYLSIPQIQQVIPGKEWVSDSVTAANSLAPGSSNPAAMLQLLASQGNTVTALGPSTVDGDAVHGYHVTIDPNYIRQSISKGGLSPAEQQAAEAVLGNIDLQMTVYTDDAADLLREVDMTISTEVEGTTVSASVTEDLTNYGRPVSITPPPPDQVVSLQQFEQAAGAIAGSGDQSNSA